jgi:hypothetical protein
MRLSSAGFQDAAWIFQAGRQGKRVIHAIYRGGKDASAVSMKNADRSQGELTFDS